MPQGVLFDLDGTLFDRESCVHEVVRAQQREFGAPLNHVDPEVYCARVLALDAHGYGEKTEVYRQIVAEFGLPKELAPRLVVDFFERLNASGYTFSDVVPALTAIRAAGLHTGIITNGKVETQQRKLEQLGLLAWLDIVLISEREGVKKPSREIYERALGQLELPGEDVWFVGDHPEADIRGAFEAGLKAVWRRTDYWPVPSVPHVAISGLDELVDMLHLI